MTSSPLIRNRKFPTDFIFGVASSAIQVEGKLNRGETSFEYQQRRYPTMVTDGSDAKIACDSYHHYNDDVNFASYLGVDFYRFSIAWSRILPTGYPNEINQDGITYYNNLINALRAKSIQPLVTIYHLDCPKPLQDLGGWVNPVMVDLFEDYCRILFRTFGDRVKNWITFNVDIHGLGDMVIPPKLNQSGIQEYIFARNVVLAHARAYHLYHRVFKSEQDGNIGFVINGNWLEPESEKDREAAERARHFYIGILANPIFGNGDFPDVVKERVEKLSREQGFFKSRLPQFSKDEIAFIKGSADFLGVNAYTTFLVRDEIRSVPLSFESDSGVRLVQDPKWESGKSSWLKVVPWGLRKLLRWINSKYQNPQILITENGFSDDGDLHDLKRITYHELYMKAVLDAIHEDEVNVAGYTIWSLLDNFEWKAGYTEKFGLIHVDFTNPRRPRTPKLSADWYKGVIESRYLNESRPPSKEQL